MKRAVNIWLDEQIIYVLNQLTEELKTTKTEIIERARKIINKNSFVFIISLLQKTYQTTSPNTQYSHQ